ncbi:MAG: RNA polymerase sigma factor [Minisyncoccales bacterium]
MKKKKKIFEKVFDREIDNIYRFIFLKVDSPQLAEDLTQEVFLKFWEKIDQIENPRPFLYKVARDRVFDYYRKREKEVFLPLTESFSNDEKVNLEKEVIKNLEIEDIQNALKFLKNDYQDVIIWHYLNDLNFQEISQLMDRSPEATRVLLHRALNNLKKVINETKQKRSEF